MTRPFLAIVATCALTLAACSAPQPPLPQAAAPTAPAAAPTTAPAATTAPSLPPTPQPAAASPSPAATAAPTLAATAVTAPTEAATSTLAAVPTPMAPAAFPSAEISASAVPSPGAGGPTGPAAAAAAGLDPVAIARAQGAVKTFRMSAHGTQDQQAFELTADVVVPDMFHATITTQPQGETTEVIVIGKDTYQKKAGGAWERTDSPPSFTNFVSGMTDVSDIATNLIGPDARVEFAGTESVRGTECRNYRVDDQGSQGELCIGSDNLIHRISSEGTVIELYDYNADIHVEAPSV